MQPDAADAPGVELNDEIGLTHAGPDRASWHPPQRTARPGRDSLN